MANGNAGFDGHLDASLSAEDAMDYIRGVCFKTGPPRSIGVELEWLVLDRAQPHLQVSPERLDKALAPLPMADDRLPSGTRITREPGGQLELSTSPAPRLLDCVTTAAEDLALAGQALRADGLELSGCGLDPFRDPQRQARESRYAAMETYFDRIGPWGRMMMRATTGIQVNLDAGTEDDGLDGYRARWQLAHRLGPVLVAAFANSPLWHGRPTGWRSTRQALWKNLDPGRTSPPHDLPAEADPRDAWARFALEAGLLCLRRKPSGDWTAPPGLTLASWLDGGITERPATLDDLDYHLTTLFPPVRPRGWLELRMIDAQPGDGWLVPTLLAAVLIDDPEAARSAWCATEPLCAASSPFPPPAVWSRAARLGTSEPEIARAALACFEAAIPALARAGVPAALREKVAAFAARYPAHGRCPADDLLDHPAALPAKPGRSTLMAVPIRPSDPANPTTRLPAAPTTAPAPTSAPAPPRTDQAPRAAARAALEHARRRTLALTDCLGSPELTVQHSPLMSPLVWDLAHIGNQEEIWLVRAAGGQAALRPDLDPLYDAFQHPRPERPALPLLTPTQARRYVAAVRERALDVLRTAPLGPDQDPLLADGFVFGMIAQHEQQHDETMLATHQLRRGPAVLHAARPEQGPADAADLPAEAWIPGGPFTMGTDDEPWALDNERRAHRVEVPGFWLDTVPVRNRAFQAFMADGGYQDPRWWSPAGWAHRVEADLHAPLFWQRAEGPESVDGGWLRRRFGVLEPVPPDEPVLHVCWYEADAYARWAGRRLPTEAEWEKAARHDPATGRSRRYPWGDQDPTPLLANLGQRHLQPAPAGAYPDGASPHGVRQLIGDVWEWTASDFAPYPGFAAFPYREYSEVFFGPDYKVLRGGAFSVAAVACRGTFRNWDYPIRRQIFAGFRTARDPRPGEGR